MRAAAQVLPDDLLRLAPGSAHVLVDAQAAEPHLDVGAVPGGVTDTTRRVAAAFATAGFVSEPRTDISAWKRRKLITNLGNAVQACCGDDPDAVRCSQLLASLRGRLGELADTACPEHGEGQPRHSSTLHATY